MRKSGSCYFGCYRVGYFVNLHFQDESEILMSIMLFTLTSQ